MKLTHEEQLRRVVRARSKELIDILASYDEYSTFGRVRKQLQRGFVTDELLDSLASDSSLHENILRCREALKKWRDFGEYRNLIATKQRRWLL